MQIVIEYGTNTVPTGDDDEVTFLEDNTATTFQNSDFTYSDGDSDPFAGIFIKSLETAGDLEYSSADVTDETEYNIPLTNLIFKPAEDANGSPYATFTHQVDDGTDYSTAGPYTMTINITAVNDEPSFTKGSDGGVLEDCGAQSVPTWATSLDKGATNESSQTLTFYVSNDNNSLFSAQPAVSSTGTLTYTPAADVSGSAECTIYVKDDGGTTNGGDEQSDNQTFNIVVTTVNDVPSFTKGSDENVVEDCGAQSVPTWATNLDKGATDESAQTLEFTVTNDNNSLFSAQPAVSSTGTLTYTPAAGEYGTTICTIYLKDNGGTANGGDDQSDNQTFNITVAEVEDLSEWGSSMNIFINTTATGANVSTTQTNFPLLIRLDTDNFDFFSETETGGGDIRFSDDDGATQLSYEIEHWVDNTEASIWVLVPSVTGNTIDQYITMYWNKASATTTEDPTVVFAASNDYDAVWHLEEEQAGATGTADVYEDATNSSNDGDDYVSATGRLGVAKYGHEFDGSDDYITVPQSASLDITGDASISGWFRLDASFSDGSGTSQIILEKYVDIDNNMMIGLAGTDYDYPLVDDGSLVFKIEDTDDFRFINTTTTGWTLDTWYYFTILIDADAPASNKVYINGVDVTDSENSSLRRSFPPLDNTRDKLRRESRKGKKRKR